MPQLSGNEPILGLNSQHVADDPPKTCYRLIYHQKILTQIFEGRA
jgi:hypothetical protein